MTSYDPLTYWTERTRKLLDTDNPALVHRDRSLEVDVKTADWLRAVLLSEELRLGHKPSILEVGCGFGRWSQILKSRYARYVGADIVADRVQVALDDYAADNVDFVVVAADGRWDVQAPADVVPVDVVMSITVLQHVDFDTTARLLQTMDRHLKPGGAALLAEWRMYDEPQQMLDARTHEAHMLPKSIPELRAVVPDLNWTGRQGRFILRKPE